MGLVESFTYSDASESNLRQNREQQISASTIEDNRPDQESVETNMQYVYTDDQFSRKKAIG